MRVVRAGVGECLGGTCEMSGDLNHRVGSECGERERRERGGFPHGRGRGGKRGAVPVGVPTAHESWEGQAVGECLGGTCEMSGDLNHRVGSECGERERRERGGFSAWAWAGAKEGGAIHENCAGRSSHGA